MSKLSVPLRILVNHRFGLGLLVGTVLLLWVGIWQHLSVMYRHTDEAVERDAANLARSLEQNIVRTVEAADQLLRFIQISYARDPVQFNLFDWAAAYQSDGLAAQLVIIGADGRLRASSLERDAAAVDLSDRLHFRVHLGTGEDRLFISEPVLGRVSGRWTVQLTRPLRDAAGRFEGVAVLSLDTAYLSRFYDSLRRGLNSVSLVGTDGVIRARAPAQEGTLGAMLPQRALQRIAASTEGSFRVSSVFDGVRRLYSFRVVPGYPLVVVVGLDLEEAFAAYRADLRRSLLAGAGATLLLTLTGFLLLRQSLHLTRSRRALRITLDRMSQGVVMAGADGKVQVLNRRARELLDLSPPLDQPGAPMAEVLARLGPGPDPEASGAALEWLRADGTAVEVQVLPLPDGATLLTCVDVTAQHAVAAAQAEARAAAEAASRAKSDFLANMSHEIRTPMNGVVGMVQVLRHSGLTDKQRGMCETITRSANALLTVLNDILDYSKLEAGKIVLEPLPCRVQELVSDVAQLLRGSAAAKCIGMQMILRVEPPPVLVDPTRLRQVLVNLLSNAVKFSESGEITVTLDGEPDPEAADCFRLRIAVRDQGIGIAPEALEHLFTRFTQADASSTRRFGGSGLGLSISRELTRIMGGDIAVWSQPEEGSEFTIRLSLPITEMSEATAEEAGEAPSGPKQELAILVAEDDEINRVVIANFLQPDGHRVSFAFNGVDAVLAVRRQSFDLILMDVMMPGMDGPTATARIRELDGPAARIPIIALTANAMSGDRERYMAAGMNGYVSKPINRRELHQTIERVLGVHAFSRSPAPVAPAPEPAVSAEVVEELDDILAGLKS